jgi:polyisoprenoid-binding protein YceI
VRFDIDPEHSRLWIEARSSVHPIHAECKGPEGFVEVAVTGEGDLDLRHPVTARLELAVDRLSSGNPLYDREMQRRVDARRYPAITGELRAMDPAGAPHRYVATGDVTFRGVTESVSDELAVSMPDDATIVLEGAHVFDIRRFGMDPPRIMMLRVHPDVNVRVRIVAARR